MRTMRRQRIIAIVNRTCRPLEVMDDGIPLTIKPGYRRLENGDVVGADLNGQPAMEHVPIATANRAMDQNKARGTVNPDDRLDCTFLIGRVGVDDIGFFQDNDDPDAELIDREMLMPEAQRAQRMSTRVSRRRTRADRTLGAGMGAQVLATSDGRIRANAGGFDGGQRPFEGPDS